MKKTPDLRSFLPTNVPYLGIKPVGNRYVVEQIFLNEAGELVIERLCDPCGSGSATRWFKIFSARLLLARKTWQRRAASE